MSAYSISILCLVGFLLLVALSVAFYFRRSTGRHAIRPTSGGNEGAGKSAPVDTEETVVLGPLFGTSEVISGYAVGADDSPTGVRYDQEPLGVRPYLRHYWASLDNDPDQTTELAPFSWTNVEADDEEPNERPALAMVA